MTGFFVTHWGGLFMVGLCVAMVVAAGLAGRKKPADTVPVVEVPEPEPVKEPLIFGVSHFIEHMPGHVQEWTVYNGEALSNDAGSFHCWTRADALRLMAWLEGVRSEEFPAYVTARAAQYQL